MRLLFMSVPFLLSTSAVAECPVPSSAKPFVELMIEQSIKTSDLILTSRPTATQLELNYLALDYSHGTVNTPSTQCQVATKLKSYCENDEALGKNVCFAFACAGLNKYHSAMWNKPAPLKYRSDLIDGAEVTYLKAPRIDVYHSFISNHSYAVNWKRAESVQVAHNAQVLDLSHELNGSGNVSDSVPNADIEIKFPRLNSRPVVATTAIRKNHQITGALKYDGQIVGEYSYLNDFLFTWHNNCSALKPSRFEESH